LFRPTLAFPVLGVGVLGAPLELLKPLSANKLPLGVFPPKLILFVAEAPLTAFWYNGLPMLDEKGEFDMLARGLPESGVCDERSPCALKLRRGVDLW
jgi:hypothetical protein